MRDPEQVFQDLSKVFGVKIRELDMKAFRSTLLGSASIVDQLNLNRAFSKTSSSFLHSAVWYRHTEITRWLLAWKADPNHQNLRGVSPMHFLAENIARKGETVRECLVMLVKAGGDMNLKNKQGLSAWDIIKSKKMHAQAQTYLKGVRPVNGVQIAWRKQILNYYDDSDHEENDPLKLSEISDKLNDSSLLSHTSSGVGTPEESKVETKKESAQRVFKELVNLLGDQKEGVDEQKFCELITDNKDIIKSGHLDLNQPTSKTGAALLHACVWYMKLDCVKALVNVAGANVMVKNLKGCTPLHLAAERGDRDNAKRVIDVLMLAGASKKAKTLKKKTPPEKAKQKEIADYILDWPRGSAYEKEHKKLLDEAELVEEDPVIDDKKYKKESVGESTALVKVEKWELDWSDMKTLFDKMDFDKNGFLNFKDIRETLANMDLTFSNRDVDLMLKSGDPDGDGQMSWDEFKGLIRRYTEVPKVRVQ